MEFERLLNIASNASPMFIIGSIGATMLGDIRLGFILLIGNYLSSIIVGILTINNSKTSLTLKELPKNNINVNFGSFERLLNIASNASPMFIIGSIGATMLGDIRLGFILLIGNYLSSIIVGILTINNSKTSLTLKELPKNNINVNFGSALKSALDNGINTTLQVGAFVVLFSIIISIIKNNTYISIVFYNIEEFLNLPKYSIYGLFLGSVEFTNGCKLITTLPLTLPFKLAIISFICSFSGLSVIAQISSFVYKYDISIAKYSFIKFIQGVISFIITFILSSVFSLQYTAYTSTTTIDNYNISIIISLSLSLLLIGTLIILLLKKLHRS